MILSAKYKIPEILFLWIIGFGGAIIFFNRIITVEHYIIAIFYFSIISIIALKLFEDAFKDIQKTMGKNKLFLILGCLMIHTLISSLSIGFLKNPEITNVETQVSFLNAGQYFLWAKPFEILLQQTLIFILIKKLNENNLSLKKIILLYAILFGINHILLIPITGLYFGLYFTIFALLSAIIFPYNIIKRKNGYLYNIIIHITFYDISAIIFRFLS